MERRSAPNDQNNNLNENNNRLMQHQPMNTPPHTPPPPLMNVPEDMANFLIDQEGNWVLPIGEDLDLEEILRYPEAQPVSPVRQRQIYNGPSLIPDRRAAQRHRQQQRYQQQRQLEEREADDEHESTSSSSY